MQSYPRSLTHKEKVCKSVTVSSQQTASQTHINPEADAIKNLDPNVADFPMPCVLQNYVCHLAFHSNGQKNVKVVFTPHSSHKLSGHYQANFYLCIFITTAFFFNEKQLLSLTLDSKFKDCTTRAFTVKQPIIPQRLKKQPATLTLILSLAYVQLFKICIGTHQNFSLLFQIF